MSTRGTALARAGIAVAVLFIYARAFSAYFFEDDFQWLVSRWAFHPADLLTLKARYKPVFELYFWAASHLFGESPVVYHAASIVIHIVNGWLILAIASRLGMSRTFAFVTAMLFVVQPSYVAAVAWVGALAESLVVLFGCASLLATLKFRETGAATWLVSAVVLFTLSLLAHESAVVFLPIIVLADRVVHHQTWRSDDLIRIFWPFITVITIYLTLTFSANTSTYVRDEMQYGLGPHIVRHIFNYVIAMYVDKPTVTSYSLVGLVMLLVLVFGTPRARFGLAWMILGTLPFAPFFVGVLSRYAYVPAIGLAFLLAEGLAALHGQIARRSVTMARAIVSVLAIFAAARFSHFARDGVKDSYNAAERYRTFLADVRREHPQLASGSVIYISPERDKIMARPFVEAAVQWEYRDPTLRVEVK